MKKTEQFRHQHTEIVAVAQDIRRFLEPDKVVEGTPDIVALLIRLSGKLKVHLQAEDAKLYPALIDSGDAEAAELAQSFQAEMGGLVEAFEGYMAAWRSPVAIEKDPDGFCEASHQLLKALGDRIERENRQLYPLADQV